MAATVSFIKQHLEAQTPGGDFLQAYSSIHVPPIDFSDALRRARQEMTQTEELLRAAGDDDATTAGDNQYQAVQRVLRQALLTQGFLTAQLHVRGSADFWQQHLTDREAAQRLASFVVFAALELLVDVVSHAGNAKMAPLALKQLAQPRYIDRLRKSFLVSLSVIERQRKSPAASRPDWQPSLADCEEVMQVLSKSYEEQGQGSGVLIGVAVAVVAVGVGIWLWRRHRLSTSRF